MKDIIRILCASDDGFVPYYGIMLTSLFENNPEERFEVFFLSGALDATSVSRLVCLAQKYNQTVRFISVGEQDLPACPIRPGDHVTLASYYRLIAASVLPDSISKILWLDGDLVVNGPIRNLWETNLSGFAFGAVKDESFCHPDIYQRLCLDRGIPYTNAGVLLINLDYWRQHDATSRYFDCIRQIPDRLLFHDQDVLNIVFQNEKKLLPLIWNLQSGFITIWEYSNYSEQFKDEIKKAMEMPVIIHYSGPSKPWLKYNLHPYRQLFKYYRNISPWKDYPTSSFGFKNSLRDGIGMLLRRIGLRRSPYIIKDQLK